MSTAANAEAFAQPHWRVIAAGFDTERWFTDGQAVGTGGILNPQPTRLPAGLALYRFASSASPPQAQLGGGWWIDHEALQTIRGFAQRNGYTLREAARLMLALPYAWTRVDRLVRALPAQPLRAWTGYGKPVQAPAGGADRGTRWIPTQHLRVRQLYLPGLFVPGRQPQLYETAFAQPPTVKPL